YGAPREVSRGRRATAVRARLSTPDSRLPVLPISPAVPTGLQTPDSGLTPDSRLARACERGLLTPRHLALQAVIASAEQCRSVSTPDADAAVVLARGIAQINWRRPDDFGFGAALEQTAATGSLRGIFRHATRGRSTARGVSGSTRHRRSRAIP